MRDGYHKYRSDIKCNICGKQLDTYTKKDYYWDEYDECDYIRYYADEKHYLIDGEYVCEECYKNMDNILLDKIKGDLKYWLKIYSMRKKEIEEEYLKKISQYESEINEIINIINKVNTKNTVSDFDKLLIEKVDDEALNDYLAYKNGEREPRLREPNFREL